MITSPSPQDILNRFLSRLQDEAGISASSNSSLARAIGVGLTDVVSALWQQLEKADSALSINTATGADLDRIGQFLGVPRKPATKASTLGYGPAVVFKNNGGTPQTIPANTAVFPISQPSNIFRTQTTIVIPAYSTATVDVESPNYGSIYNIAAGAINAHNQGSNAITVTNPRAIDSGADQETDDSYRGRLYQAQSLRNPSSKTAIRLALASLPGVKDVVLIENTGGAGTFDVVLIGVGSTVPQQSVVQAQNYLSEYAPLGVSWRVLLPKEVPADITCVISLPASLEPSRAALVATVSQAIRAYINTLTIENGSGDGSEFIFSQLLTAIGNAAAGATDYTVDVSIGNQPLVFGGNYSAQIGERIVTRRILVQ